MNSKNNILFIINSLAAGGAEKLLVENLPVYQQKGWKVSLLLLDGTPTPFYNQLRNNPEIRIFSLSTGSLYKFSFIFKIRSFLSEYEIVHVHLFPSLYWTALAAFLSRSKPVLILTEHTPVNRRMKKGMLLRKAEQWIYRRFHHIVCVSETVKNRLQNHLGLPDSHFSVIENGVDLAGILQAEPCTEVFFENAPDTVILIQVASFNFPKDQETVLRALGLLPEHVKLLLVGSGQNKQRCKNLAAELGVAPRVRFLGVRTDIPQLLKSADIVVLSSRYEGLSLASIEGMAAAPVVASDAEGLREIVGGYGLLFKTGSSEELAAVIRRLTEDVDFYHQIKAQCRERALDFSHQKMIESHLKLYRELIRAQSRTLIL